MGISRSPASIPFCSGMTAVVGPTSGHTAAPPADAQGIDLAAPLRSNG
jgi:hypothetical protein